jgi:hypothetical protein
VQEPPEPVVVADPGLGEQAFPQPWWHRADAVRRRVVPVWQRRGVQAVLVVLIALSFVAIVGGSTGWRWVGDAVVAVLLAMSYLFGGPRRPWWPRDRQQR